jgi:hypothetical protein
MSVPYNCMYATTTEHRLEAGKADSANRHGCRSHIPVCYCRWCRTEKEDKIYASVFSKYHSESIVDTQMSSYVVKN